MRLVNLPKFNIPDMEQKRLTPEAFQRIILHNMELMAKSGQLRLILDNPNRRPVNKRFSL